MHWRRRAAAREPRRASGRSPRPCGREPCSTARTGRPVRRPRRAPRLRAAGSSISKVCGNGGVPGQPEQPHQPLARSRRHVADRRRCGTGGPAAPAGWRRRAGEQRPPAGSPRQLGDVVGRRRLPRARGEVALGRGSRLVGLGVRRRARAAASASTRRAGRVEQPGVGQLQRHRPAHQLGVEGRPRPRSRGAGGRAAGRQLRYEADAAGRRRRPRRRARSSRHAGPRRGRAEPADQLAAQVLGDLLAPACDALVDGHDLGDDRSSRTSRPRGPRPRHERGPRPRVGQQRDQRRARAPRRPGWRTAARAAAVEHPPERRQVAGQRRGAAAIASTSTMPKLSPPVCGATYRSTERSARALSSSVTRPEERRSAQPGRQLARALVDVARPGDEQPQAGMRASTAGSASTQDRQALAGLVDPAEEPSAPGRSPGQPGSGSASANAATYTPLGITTASPPRCVDQVRAGVLADRDAAARSSPARLRSTE